MPETPRQELERLRREHNSVNETPRQELERLRALHAAKPELSDTNRLARSISPVAFDIGAGAKTGIENAISGARQLFNFDDPQIQAEESANIAKRDARLESLSPVAEGAGFVAELAPSVALPGGPTGGLVKRVAGGVAADIAATVADPVREGQTREGNLRDAALFSGGARSVGGVLSKGAQRLFSAASGDIPKKEIREIVQNADANEISIFFDDVSSAPFAKKASVASEVFGVAGTAPGRARQNDEALAAAQRWVQRVSGDVDSYDEIVQEGLQNKLTLFRKRASEKYARVARDIGNAGEVATTSFDKAAQDGIAAEATKGTRANAAVQDFLTRFKDAPRADFDGMIEFRSDFNKEVNGFLADNLQLGKSSINAISKAQRALDDDMAAFARANGAEASWRAANDFYRNTVVQFKKGKLRNLVNQDSAANFDEQAAWKYLVSQTTNPKRAQNMWNALDRKGREAVRFGLLSEALEAATVEGKPFSPARFAGFLEKRLPVADQFFRGQSKEEINGLIKVMRHIERAGQFAENPPTGQRLIPLLIGTGSIIDPRSVAIGAGFATGIRTLFQTKTGRNLLLGANKATPGSKRFDQIVEGMERAVSRSTNQ